MQAHVSLRAPNGALAELVPGDFIGRSYAAALQLDDGRVSEAHAMVSLREGQLQLLPLRGSLAVAGEPVSWAALKPGGEVQLAPGLALIVEEVHLPDAVLALEGPGMPRQMLPSVASVLFDTRARLVQGWREDAAVQVWTTGAEFRVRQAGVTRVLSEGDVLTVGTVQLRVVTIPLGEAGPRTTRRQGEFDAPLHLVAHFDTVHIHREGGAPLVFAGMQARLFSELVAMDGPVNWTTLTEELWPDEPDAVLRRGRLDALLLRVRRRLRAAGVRADLIRSDGAGTVEIVRYPHDRIEDQT